MIHSAHFSHPAYVDSLPGPLCVHNKSVLHFFSCPLPLCDMIQCAHFSHPAYVDS